MVVTSVTLRKHDVTVEALSVNDTSTEQALQEAKALHTSGVEFDKAMVDRFDGLVLVGAHGAWHFQTPSCGYQGNGPQAAATILDMFGFGTIEEVMYEIKREHRVVRYR